MDTDPGAYAHGRLILSEVAHTAIVHTDLREPDQLLGHPLLARHLDLTRPVAVVANSVLPFVADADDSAALIAAYRDAIVPASCPVLSHATDEHKPERAARTSAIY